MLLSRLLIWGLPFLVAVGVGLAPLGFDDGKEPSFQGRSVSVLRARLEAPDVDMRRDAAQALGQLGEDAEEAIPELIVALRDADPIVRRRAAHALGNIGPKAKEARTALRWTILDKDRFVFQTAATALRRIEGQKTEHVSEPGTAVGEAVVSAPSW
jgi:hypothetical protein